MNYISKVSMVFAKVNYRVIERSIKESVILADYDELLCDLMHECIQKGNNKTLQIIVRLVRATKWMVNNKCERVADIAESLCFGLKTIEDDVAFELPAYEQVRVLRVLCAIWQGIGFQAKQWQEALPLNNSPESLKSLKADLWVMEDYSASLYDLLTRLGCNYSSSTYTWMRVEAVNMLTDARCAVDAKLDASGSVKN